MIKQLIMFFIHMYMYVYAGAQLREWLLYFSLPVLHGILPSSLFSHYCYLVAGVHIVLADAISPAQMSCADDCFREFYSHFSTIYGMSSFLLESLFDHILCDPPQENYTM